MKIIPLAAESLGVRSMATFVEVAGTGILIDPGATLAPSRFGLPPAEAEWEALRRANDRISAYALRASLVFVSHYHEDHFRYDPGVYEGRTVWAKDPRHMINPRQGGRAAELWAAIERRCRSERHSRCGLAVRADSCERCNDTVGVVLAVEPRVHASAA